MHLTFELYLMVLRGELPPSLLVEVAHQHIVDLCDTCSAEWDIFHQHDRTGLPITSGALRPSAQPEAGPSHRSIFGSTAHQTEARLARVRQERRKAQQDLTALLRLEPSHWEARVERAQTRYRSRAFSELLLAEARARVGSEPNVARRLAALVPVVLHWIPGIEKQEWRLILEVRALVHEANALRVVGRLADAEECFAEARSQLAYTPINDPRVYAEVASLEASLRIAQRRSKSAVLLLNQAILLFNFVNDNSNLVRVLIQRANVSHNLNQPAEALDFLDRAASLIDPEAAPFLHLCTVTSRVLCLCDLDRADEAWDLLHRHLDLYEASDDPWVRVSVQDLRGRVLLGLECHEEAAEAFAACRDGALELGRDYDAALASLDLALVYLEQGRTAELTRLAGELVPTFQARGVDREALAALRLVQQAVTAEELTRSVLADVRERLRRANPGD